MPWDLLGKKNFEVQTEAENDWTIGGIQAIIALRKAVLTVDVSLMSL